MNRKTFWLLFIFILGLAGSARAIEPAPDPFERNLIFVEGNSEVTVPVNGFDLVFGFDVEKGSFEQTERASGEIIKKIESSIAQLGAGKVEVLKGWDLVKQAKISLASKGRKISNKITIRVTDFPAGKMHELLAKIIDRSIQADGNVALEQVRVFATEAREMEAQKKAVDQALVALQANAENAAVKVGRQLTDPKRIFVSNDPQLFQSEAFGYQGDMMRMASFVSVQKSFNVQSEISDSVTISARVSGIYQLS